MSKWAVLSLSFLLFCGYLGVYYNLFYNAEKAYREGVLKEKKYPGAGRNNFEKSIEKCLKVLNKYPDSKWADEALYLLAMNYYYLGEYAKSVEQFKNYLLVYQGSKRDNEVKFYQALALINLERYSEARLLLKELLEKKGWKEKAMFYIAISYKKEKAFDEAEMYFKNFIEKYKKSKFTPKAKLELGKILEEKGDTLSAIRWYEDYIKNMPTSKEKYEVMVRLGELYLEQKKYDEVIDLLKNAIGVYSEYDTKMKLLIGKAYYFKKDYSKALSYFEDVRTGEEGAEAFYYTGLIYEEKNDLEKAILYYDSVKTKSQVSNFYILSLRRKAVIEAMNRDTTDTVKIDPAENQFLLAETYFVNFENYDRAIEEYEKLIEKFPDSKYVPKAMYAIGWINKYKKKDTIWKEIFREIIEKYPDTPYAEYAKKEILK